jgi:hypothetical protein
MVFEKEHDSIRWQAIAKEFVGGAGAAAIHSTFSTPIELVKIRMQTSSTADGKLPYSNSFQCAYHILRSEGLRGLYRGYTAVLCKDVPGIGLYFASFYTFKKLLMKDKPISHMNGWDHVDQTLRLLACGGFSGVVAWLTVFPADVIKSNLQRQSRLIILEGGSGTTVSVPHIYYTGVFHCAKALFLREGWRIFYVGIAPNLLASFVGSAVSLSVNELLHLFF